LEIIKFGIKWLHLMSIATIVGGTIFMYVQVNVRQAVSDGADRDPFRESKKHIALVLAIGWVVALFTGFINFMFVASSGTAEPSWHMWAGMKIVLALIMCGLTIYMGHLKPKAEGGINREPLLVGLLALGAVIVGLSAHLNMSRLARVPKIVQTTVAAPGTTTPVTPTP
jgi:hypothetical protein